MPRRWAIVPLILASSGLMSTEPVRAAPDCPPNISRCVEDVQAYLAEIERAASEVSGALGSNSADLADALNAMTNGALAQLAGEQSASCSPGVAGKDLVQRTSIVVGEIFGRDFATGTGFCTKIGGSTYTSRIDVEVQAYNMPQSPNMWTAVCGVITGLGVPNGQHAQVLPPTTAACSYPSGNPYLGRWHRGYAKITTSLGDEYKIVTPNIWFMSS